MSLVNQTATLAQAPLDKQMSEEEAVMIERLLKDHGTAYFLDEFGQPTLNERRGGVDHKVIVITIFKSGTFLMKEFLEIIGVEFTGMHLWMNRFYDHRFKSISENRAADRRTGPAIAFNYAIKLVASGQFAVSHIGYLRPTAPLLKDFKIIFCKRDIRSALVSYMRWIDRMGLEKDRSPQWLSLPEGPGKFRGYLDDVGKTFIASYGFPLIPWIEHPDSCVVEFESFTGENGADAQTRSLALVRDHLSIDMPMDRLMACLNRALDSETVTKSSSRTRWIDYWSDEAEERFEAFGGRHLNRLLGYAQ